MNSLIDKIKDRIPLEDVARQYTELQRNGTQRLKGLCPLHHEDTPSFFVFADGHFHCFGCQKHGDVIDLFALHENLMLGDAVTELAKRAGIALTPRTPEQEHAIARKRSLETILAIAANFYHAELADDANAVDYLHQRGLKDATIEDRSLGVARGGLGVYFKTHNLDLALGIDSGLLREDGSDFFYDHRIMIPYFERGRCVYLSGRALDEQKPKYLHLPKPRLLYNIDALRGTDDLVLTEGTFDVIALGQLGYSNAIGLNGTSLDDDLLEAIRRHKRVMVNLDTDTAGQTHAVNIARQIGKVALIASLPDGADDPAAFIASGATKEQVQTLFDTARDLLMVEIDLIPANLTRLQLAKQLEPILRQLATMPPAEAGAVLWHTIKPHFQLNYKDTQGYERSLSDLRRELKEKTKLDAARLVERDSQARREQDEKQRAEICTQLISMKISLLDIHEQLEVVLGDQGDLLEIVLATSAIPNLKPPVWLLVVGVPSSGKTEVVRLLRLNPNGFYIDTMTENAFVSGYILPDGTEPKDLLPLLNGKIFVCKDLTTLFSLQEDTIRKLLGDLTSIYDGEFRKYTATRGDIHYASSFGFIACITPAALNSHQRYLNMIGPRFLTYRVPPLTNEQIDQGFVEMWNNHDRSRQLDELADMVGAFAYQLAQKNINTVNVDQGARQKLKGLSKLLARGRGVIVMSQSKFKDAEGQERAWAEVVEAQIEEPWRGYHQIESLARALAVVHNRDIVTTHELELIRRIVLASMPPARGDALAHFADANVKKNGYVVATDMGELTGTSVKTARNLLEELHALKILEKTKEGTQAARYSPISEFSDLITEPRAALDHISDYFSG